MVSATHGARDKCTTFIHGDYLLSPSLYAYKIMHGSGNSKSFGGFVCVCSFVQYDFF